MQNLYYAQQTAKTEAVTTEILSEKIRRLEQALDEAQASQITEEAKPYEANLIAGLRADAAQLAQEKYQMRNCGNCSKEHCSELSDYKVSRSCRKNDLHYWNLDDV